MLSLFELTFGNWVPITRTLFEWEKFCGFLAMCYVVVVNVAIMMVVRGVFIHETFRIAATDAQLMVVQAKRKAQQHRSHMQLMMEAIDVDGDQFISIQEFQAALETPNIAL